jgi:hypothetical protein
LILFWVPALTGEIWHIWFESYFKRSWWLVINNDPVLGASSFQQGQHYQTRFDIWFKRCFKQ